MRNKDETSIFMYIHFAPAFDLIKTNIGFVNDFDL